MEASRLLEDDGSCGFGDVGVGIGEKVTIVSGKSSANVEIPDVETCSGIVRIIKSVLLPCLLLTSEEPVASPAVAPHHSSGATSSLLPQNSSSPYEDVSTEQKQLLL